MTSALVVGIPGSRRLAFFQQALTALGIPPAQEICYADLLDQRINLAGCIQPDALVRIDSPGENFRIEKRLLKAGASLAEAEAGPVISPREIDQLSFDRGRILFPRQWYLGFCVVLQELAQQLSAAPRYTTLNCPAEIALLFDKSRCQQVFSAAGIPVPRSLGVPRSPAEVVELMHSCDCRRAFLKIRHGSSGSGVVALHLSRAGLHAVTSVELVHVGGRRLLYNSRKIRSYRQPEDLVALLDELCRHGVQFEEWLPKASLGEGVFDVRVVVIGGRARHAIVRSSRWPITNLHLGNRRGDLTALVSKTGTDRWAEAMEICQRAAALFPNSVHVAIDLLLKPGFREPTVLEANAFGDFLPGALHEGQDTYLAELEFLLRQPQLIS